MKTWIWIALIVVTLVIGGFTGYYMANDRVIGEQGDGDLTKKIVTCTEEYVACAKNCNTAACMAQCGIDLANCNLGSLSGMARTELASEIETIFSHQGQSEPAEEKMAP